MFEGSRLFSINYKPILIRGSEWAPDMFLRKRDYIQHLEYAKHLGLNLLRSEGKFEDDDWFDLTDKYGFLVLPGWPCCDAWEHWEAWGEE